MDRFATRDTDKYFNAPAEKVAPAPFAFTIASCILLFIDLAAFDFDPREEAEKMLSQHHFVLFVTARAPPRALSPRLK